MIAYQFILQEHLSVFVLNGYEELENFHDLNEAELDYLGITEPGQRAKIMSAVDLMQDTCKLHRATRWLIWTIVEIAQVKQNHMCLDL